MIEAPNEWIETVHQGRCQKGFLKNAFFKVQWSLVLIPSQNSDNKTILKNLKQHFMSVIKLKRNLWPTVMAAPIEP